MSGIESKAFASVPFTVCGCGWLLESVSGLYSLATLRESSRGFARRVGKWKGIVFLEEDFDCLVDHFGCRMKTPTPDFLLYSSFGFGFELHDYVFKQRFLERSANVNGLRPAEGLG